MRDSIAFTSDPVAGVMKDDRLFRVLLLESFQEAFEEVLDDCFDPDCFPSDDEAADSLAHYRAAVIEACMAARAPVAAFLRLRDAGFDCDHSDLKGLESMFRLVEEGRHLHVRERSRATGWHGPVSEPMVAACKGASGTWSVLAWQPPSLVEEAAFLAIFLDSRDGAPIVTRDGKPYPCTVPWGCFSHRIGPADAYEDEVALLRGWIDRPQRGSRRRPAPPRPQRATGRGGLRLVSGSSAGLEQGALQ